MTSAYFVSTIILVSVPLLSLQLLGWWMFSYVRKKNNLRTLSAKEYPTVFSQINVLSSETTDPNVKRKLALVSYYYYVLKFVGIPLSMAFIAYRIFSV